MSAPVDELVLHARDRLLKAAPVAAMLGERIWYAAPADAVFPYIAGFETSGLRNDAVCVAGTDATLDIHGWARDGVDPLQTLRKLARVVANALHHFDLPLPSGGLLTLNHRGERIFFDADGLTGHGVFEFRAIFRTG